MGVKLPKEAMDYFQGGSLISTTMMCVTRDADRVSSMHEAVAVAVADDGDTFSVVIPLRFSKNLVENIEANGEFGGASADAMGDHTSYQLKGKCSKLEGPSKFTERITKYLDDVKPLAEQMGFGPIIDGMRPLADEDAYVVTVQIDACYGQSPGPGAGTKLEVKS